MLDFLIYCLHITLNNQPLLIPTNSAETGTNFTLHINITSSVEALIYH